uniref:Reverse transcriptase domain-containing protein n=1 Tax=Megaselia scalaris TaxID=36166 RepID=T1GCW1_MEGSC
MKVVLGDFNLQVVKEQLFLGNIGKNYRRIDQNDHHQQIHRKKSLIRLESSNKVSPNVGNNCVPSTSFCKNKSGKHMTENVPSPTKEVRNAIHRLKNNKSAGPDCIRAELLKAADINYIDAFHQLLVKIWNAEIIWHPIQPHQILPNYFE